MFVFHLKCFLIVAKTHKIKVLEHFQRSGLSIYCFVFQKNGFLGISYTPYCGISATIRIGREMLYLPYAGFFFFFSQQTILV